MAKYPAVITTMAGTNATAEANASKQALIFTKIVIGAGDPPASIARATSLTDKRLELDQYKAQNLAMVNLQFGLLYQMQLSKPGSMLER